MYYSKNDHTRPPCFIITLPKTRKDRPIFLNEIWKLLKNKHNMNNILTHDIRLHENIKELYDDAVGLVMEKDVLLLLVQLDFLGSDEVLPNHDCILSYLFIPYSIPLFILPPNLNSVENEWVNELFERFRKECSEVYILPQDEAVVASTIATKGEK